MKTLLVTFTLIAVAVATASASARIDSRVRSNLDGKAALPPSAPPALKVNVQDNPAEVLDPKQIAMGKAMFMACAACHGRNMIGAGGPAPDLRESSIPLSPEAFWSVVHDGALIERGMPRFGMFGKPEIEALRQYVRARARAATTTLMPGRNHNSPNFQRRF